MTMEGVLMCERSAATPGALTLVVVKDEDEFAGKDETSRMVSDGVKSNEVRQRAAVKLELNRQALTHRRGRDR